VELVPGAPPNPLQTPAWETIRDFCRADISSPSPEATEFLFASPLIRLLPELADYAKISFTGARPILDAVLHLMARMHKDFQFDPRATTVATPLEQVIKNRRGVCQDFAHFKIGCLRALGLPARYVSGYMETLPPLGKPRLTGADASHAWVQVFIPPATWIDVDPTNNLLPSDRHILLAWGRDFEDVSPIRGVIVGGGKHELKVGVDVIPVVENAGDGVARQHADR
jgi:transglutaminase-like putative cysteine protease